MDPSFWRAATASTSACTQLGADTSTTKMDSAQQKWTLHTRWVSAPIWTNLYWQPYYPTDGAQTRQQLITVLLVYKARPTYVNKKNSKPPLFYRGGKKKRKAHISTHYSDKRVINTWSVKQNHKQESVQFSPPWFLEEFSRWVHCQRHLKLEI